MKVLLISHGSRGDIQPYLALARALNAAGHEATLAAPADWAPLAAPYGVRFAPLYDELKQLLKEPAVSRAFETNFRGPLGKARAAGVMRRFRPMMTRMLEDMAAAAEGGTDLVAFQPIVPGHEVAEWLGVPAVPVGLQPIWIPTPSFRNPMVPSRIPSGLHRASYLWTRLWFRGFAGDLTGWRRRTLGLRHRPGQHNPLRRPDGSPATFLQAFSRHLLPAPPQYPSWVHTTGFWYLPAEPGWRPPRHLMQFLDAGEPPVYIGFGSMSGSDPRRTGRLVAEAVRLAGVRAVVVAGWGGIGADDLMGDDILTLDEVPFDWLLPRTAAVVHHGGTGTTGSALASGRPQVICPFITDQPFNATRMHALGLATAPIPQPRLTRDGLALAIRHAITRRDLIDTAAEIGRQVRADGGVSAAVDLLEREITEVPAHR